MKEKISQHYSRREWLQMSSMAVAAASLPTILLAIHHSSTSYRYQIAVTKAVPFSLPANKSVPFNWAVAELPVNASSIQFSWSKKINPKGSTIQFRLTSATDVREECVLELATANQIIGTLDVRYAHYMQPFEIDIPLALLPQILSDGLTVKMIKGTKPYWFFVQDSSGEIPDAFLPHLLFSDGNASGEAWKEKLLSFSSLSTFGWMEGCVLDGISMMAEKNASYKKILQQHFNKYFANNGLVYETYNNERIHGKVDSVESLLPFALLALQQPRHVMLQKAIDFCLSKADASQVVADTMNGQPVFKTEECYTLSYPLALLGKQFNNPGLEKMAIVNLQQRVKLLTTPDYIYQKKELSGKASFPNWARGVGWYLLGLAKSLPVLPRQPETDELRMDFQQAALMVIRHQRTDGLWNCFLHQPETGIDTSGSASIAAALAYGYSKQLLPTVCIVAAEKCNQGLKKYLSPDGYLKGSAQVNKGGEALQRNGFRVISPYTLGFLAILNASLKG